MPQDLSALIPRIIAQAVLTLRENVRMPLLVNRAYDSAAGQLGSTIDVPIPSALTGRAVSPSANFPTDDNDLSPTYVPIVLDDWYEVAFYLTDKDLAEVGRGIVPMALAEAVKTLTNYIEGKLLGLYKGFYSYVGSPGVTPFGSGRYTLDATEARTRLNKQLAPVGDRRMILDPDAEGAALELPAFRDYSAVNSTDAILRGEIMERLGFSFFMNQLIPTHTVGTAISGGATITNSANHVAGSKTITLKVATGTATLVPGDIITFAGNDQTYTVTAPGSGSNYTLDTSGVSVNIYPGLAAPLTGGDAPVAVTGLASHVANIAFHRNAIGFATRPLLRSQHPNAVIEQVTDSTTGLSLQLEMVRQNHRDRWTLSTLFGASVIRPELGTRILG